MKAVISPVVLGIACIVLAGCTEKGRARRSVKTAKQQREYALALRKGKYGKASTEEVVREFQRVRDFPGAKGRFTGDNFIGMTNLDIIQLLVDANRISEARDLALDTYILFDGRPNMHYGERSNFDYAAQAIRWYAQLSGRLGRKDEALRAWGLLAGPYANSRYDVDRAKAARRRDEYPMRLAELGTDPAGRIVQLERAVRDGGQDANSAIEQLANHYLGMRDFVKASHYYAMLCTRDTEVYAGRTELPKRKSLLLDLLNSLAYTKDIGFITAIREARSTIKSLRPSHARFVTGLDGELAEMERKNVGKVLMTHLERIGHMAESSRSSALREYRELEKNVGAQVLLAAMRRIPVINPDTGKVQSLDDCTRSLTYGSRVGGDFDKDPLGTAFNVICGDGSAKIARDPRTGGWLRADGK